MTFVPGGLFPDNNLSHGRQFPILAEPDYRDFAILRIRKLPRDKEGE